MPSAVLEQAKSAYASARSARRIGLSDFSHGRKWRDDLAEGSVLEIVDRTETAGWLLSDRGMGELLGRIDELEAELEQAQLAAVFAARAGRENWKSGDELAKAAKAALRKRRPAIEEALSADE